MMERARSRYRILLHIERCGHQNRGKGTGEIIMAVAEENSQSQVILGMQCPRPPRAPTHTRYL